MLTSSAALSRLVALTTLVGFGVGFSLSPALANDGGLAVGGSPGLLKAHPSVEMTSEVIRMTVDGDFVSGTVTVDCRFVFTNHGKACTARMGFPDEGEGAFDPDEEADAEDVMKTPPTTTFQSFRSWVDGREVPTKLIRANKEGKYWHTKMVAFPAHCVRQVRDVYTQKVGGGVATSRNNKGGFFVDQIGYILHTGASWHGNIGRSEVIVTFRNKQLPAKLRLLSSLRVGNGREVSVPTPSQDVVVWKGPCKPTVSGRTLRFVRNNWRPTASDDIELTFAYPKSKIPTHAW